MVMFDMHMAAILCHARSGPLPLFVYLVFEKFLKLVCLLASVAKRWRVQPLVAFQYDPMAM